MDIIKTGQKSFEVIDAKSGMKRYTQHAGGTIIGTPIVQNGIASVQVQNGQTVRVRVYDLKTGMLKYTV